VALGGQHRDPGDRGSVRSWLGDAVLTKNDNGLIQAVNRALNHVIENGTYEKVLDRWGLGNQAVDKSEINPPGLPMKS
jgi:polar amino acid transport system substrate-binding protein